MPRDPADDPNKRGPRDRERLQHMLDAALDVRTYVTGGLVPAAW